MRRDAIRWPLAALLLLVALNAFGGGYYGMAGAPGVPTEWLDGSPFDSYFVPGLVLFVAIGGAFLVAAVAVLARATWSRTATAAAVGVVATWLTVQLVIIGYVSWMQPVTAIAALVIGLLAWRWRPARAALAR